MKIDISRLAVTNTKLGSHRKKSFLNAYRYKNEISIGSCHRSGNENYLKVSQEYLRDVLDLSIKANDDDTVGDDHDF